MQSVAPTRSTTRVREYGATSRTAKRQSRSRRGSYQQHQLSVPQYPPPVPHASSTSRQQQRRSQTPRSGPHRCDILRLLCITSQGTRQLLCIPSHGTRRLLCRPSHGTREFLAAEVLRRRQMAAQERPTRTMNRRCPDVWANGFFPFAHRLGKWIFLVCPPSHRQLCK